MYSFYYFHKIFDVMNNKECIDKQDYTTFFKKRTSSVSMINQG